LSYPDTDVFVICFSVVNRSSFLNIKSHWIPELLHYCQSANIIICGLKTDLREDPLRKNEIVEREEGEKLREEVDARIYLECSSFTQEGLKNVFEQAAKEANFARDLSRQKPQKKKGCFIL